MSEESDVIQFVIASQANREYKELLEVKHYKLCYNPNYDEHDDNDAYFFVIHKELGTLEYKSLCYPMAIEAMLNLDSSVDNAQSLLEKRLREIKGRDNKVVSLIPGPKSIS